MPEPLTPEQINLLRGLPGQLSELKKSPDAKRLFLAGLLTRIGSPEYSTVVRTRAADLLLATIDSERERVLEAIVGDLENAATDCDGHTPYSILMALAEEIRAEHSANPQTKEAGQ